MWMDDITHYNLNEMLDYDASNHMKKQKNGTTHKHKYVINNNKNCR